MPILAISLIVLALLWFYLASPQFKLVTIASALLATGLAFSVKQNPNLGDAGTALTAVMATAGITLIAIIAGIMRKMASSPEAYITRRNAFYKFVGKWGAIYAVFSFVITILVFLIGTEFDVNQMNYENWRTSSTLAQFLPFKPFVFIGLLIFYKIFVKPNINRRRATPITNE